MNTHNRKTVGFMAGQLVVPQDFDSMSCAQITGAFEASSRYALKELLGQRHVKQPTGKDDDAWHAEVPTGQVDI